MPKVTQEYKTEKRNQILDATIEVLKEKPLYEISMLDVIKKAGLSKGGIYLYFKDIDELLLGAINRVAKEQTDIDFSSILAVEDCVEGLCLAFDQLGDYIDSCPSIISKIRFELMIYMSQNREKRQRLMPELELQNMGQKFMETVVIFIQKGMQQGVFRQDIELPVIISNISAYTDGITEQIVSTVIYDEEPLKCSTKTYLRQFIESQISYIRIK